MFDSVMDLKIYIAELSMELNIIRNMRSNDLKRDLANQQTLGQQAKYIDELEAKLQEAEEANKGLHGAMDILQKELSNRPYADERDPECDCMRAEVTD